MIALVFIGLAFFGFGDVAAAETPATYSDEATIAIIKAIASVGCNATTTDAARAKLEACLIEKKSTYPQAAIDSLTGDKKCNQYLTNPNQQITEANAGVASCKELLVDNKITDQQISLVKCIISQANSIPDKTIINACR